MMTLGEKTFCKDDEEFISNGHYKVDGIDYKSIWKFKNDEISNDNLTVINKEDSRKIIENYNGIYYNSIPLFGEFSKIKIYPVEILKQHFG